MTTSAPRDRLGHFRILSKLGEGGMGVVYRARDEQLARDVAVKVLPAESFADRAARARLLREARSAAALNHPNICSVYEVGEDGGQAFIAMELVEGQPLTEILASGPLPAADLTRWGLQLAEALEHAHGRRIVHRDLKSANIVVDAEGRAKVLDFGLAKPFHGAGEEEATRATDLLTEVGVISGTLAYMAPEQLRGAPADARSDIWALGVVLHEMAAGARPFQADTGFALGSAILNDPAAPLPAAVPVEIRAVIDRCLEKDPARRYQSASQVTAALRAIQSGTAGAWITWRYRVMRSAWLPAAVVALAVLAVAGYLGRDWVRVHVLGGAPKLPSLAVLPLENLSHDADQDYLADGFHEALITELSGVPGLRVIQRASLRRFAGTTKPPAQIARELNGVTRLVTGTVLKAGSRLLVTIHLMNGATEDTIWDGKYEREMSDVLALQGEIVGAIARELQARLAPGQKARLGRKVKPATYELVARARFHANKATPEEFDKAVAMLKQAIRDDPDEPLAQSTLAIVYALMAHERIPGVEPGPTARHAVQVDPSSADAHLALAMAMAYDEWNLDGAGKEYEEALRLNPNLPDAQAQYAWYLKTQGRTNNSLDRMRQAQANDPLNPLYSGWLAEMLEELHRHDEALEQTRKALDLDPAFLPAAAVQVLALGGKGMHTEAIELARSLAARDASLQPVLARAYVAAGRSGEAKQVLAEARRAPDSDAWQVLNAYVELRDDAQAIEWIKTMVAGRHVFCPWIDPHLRLDETTDGLRSNPQYQATLGKIKPLAK